MRDCMITFRSVTPAQTAEALLKEAGIRCMLGRTPRWLREQGCGYCLWLARAEAMNAVYILRNQNVVFQKVYLQADGGNVRELEL